MKPQNELKIENELKELRAAVFATKEYLDKED